MIVGKPVRVTRIVSRGVCTGNNENGGKPYVMFYTESPLIDGSERDGSCYGGDWYHVRPNILQVRAWRQGMTWGEFKKAGIFRK